MRWLVIGGGVLGSVYAASLARVGIDVRLIARGERALQIDRHGVVLVDEATGSRTMTRVPVITGIGSELDEDIGLVFVRRNQLDDLLPALAATRLATIAFMTNNAAGPSFLCDGVGRERVVLGIPGAGGCRDGEVVRFRRTSRLIQPTMLGDVDGTFSPRLTAIADGLTRAGFPVALERRMDAWLKTHAALVSPVANAIYAAGGSTRALGRRPDILRDLIAAVSENLEVLRTLGIPIVPRRYAAFLSLPTPVITAILRAGLQTDRAELLLARHANAARDEMSTIFADLETLRRRAHLAATHALRLARALGP